MQNCYVYLIKNKITNQFYYGSRAGNVRKNLSPKEDLWIYYFTSSKKVKSMINEYGLDSFEAIVVFEHKDYKVCFWKEQELIIESKLNPLRLNRTYMDPATSKRILTTYGETENDKILRYKKISESKKGKFNSNGHLGLKRSDKTKQKMSESQRKRILSQDAMDRIVKARLGYVVSEETKKKISESKKGKIVSEETRQKLREKSLENWKLRKT